MEILGGLGKSGKIFRLLRRVVVHCLADVLFRDILILLESESELMDVFIITLTYAHESAHVHLLVILNVDA